MRRGAVLAVAAVAAALTACDDGSAAPVQAEDPASPEASAAGPGTEQAALGGPVRVELRAGSLASDPRVRVVERYVAARQTSLRERGLTDPMARLATFTWLNHERDTIDEAARRGWTVPAGPVVAVTDVSATGPDAVVQTCLWEPSVAFVERRTQRPAQPTPEEWTPMDVKMVEVDGHWMVDRAALANHACTGGT